MSRDGKREDFSPQLARLLGERKDGVTGLAPGPGGSLYVAAGKGVLRVAMDGAVTILAYPVVVEECSADGDGAPANPRLRGLAVGDDGTAYAAASGCRCVLRITAKGEITSILKSEVPWSPTGVAMKDQEIYALEYTHANGGPGDGWTPRVRKLSPDGRVTTLATVPAA